MVDARTDDEIAEAIFRANARACAAHADMLRLLAEADRREFGERTEAQDMAAWVGINLGISWWQADRLVKTARALESLPLLRSALATGELGIEKVVELSRFATPEEEELLISWARNVPPGRIREEGDLRAKRSREESADISRERSVRWRYHDEGRRFALSADYPAAEGAVLAQAIELVRGTLPKLPEDVESCTGAPAEDASRANGLLALATERVAPESDAGRATVVIHVRADAVARGEGSRIEGGGIAGPETVDRLLCHARVQAVLEDGSGNAVRMTTAAHDPTPTMMRQLRYRDVGCTFPGCGSKRYSIAHHIAWWGLGGPTELGNLVLVCKWHHHLVHDFGWSLTRRADGEVRWYRPDGRRFRAGPGPPPRDGRGSPRAGPDRQLVVA